MVETYSFGYWVLRRRKALDLTRAELASKVGCVQETIKKIERDERRPSHQIAALLAKALVVPPDEQALFIQVARGERSVDRLRSGSSPFEPLPAQSHNLPIQSTSFIGRQADIDSLKASLDDPQVRLCTIIGPGGIGKTRLALQVAPRLLDSYPGGVWLVELAGISNPTLLPKEISITLGIFEQPNRSLSDILVDFIRSCPRLLLVLDNCEHLLESCADLSSQLLKNCPNLQVLASSRQSLGLSGEVIWPVTGLSLPATIESTKIIEDQALNLSLLPEQSEAIQLFIERARLVQPHFHLTARNVSAVAQICQDLDGMPLAIELAATRLNVLSAEEIAARLNERLQFLRGVTRDVVERHQTLRAVVDWSYQLLKPAERHLFNRLSVFRGGFTMEAAEAIAGELLEGSSILDLLTSLVEKSMLVAQTNGLIKARYNLLETLRLFGQERLVENSEEKIIRQRHAAYFTELAEQADPHLRGPQQVAWLETLETEHDNLRAALEWTANHDPATGLRLASALWWFWITRVYLKEGREWLERFLDLTKASQFDITNVKAYVRYAYLMTFQLDDQQFSIIAEEALRRSRQVEDLESIAMSLYLLADDPWRNPDTAVICSLLEESLALFRQAGNSWGMAAALRGLGEIAYVHLRNYPEAKKLGLESLAHSRETGERRSISIVLRMLGDIERKLGHWETAAAYYQESLSYFRTINDRRGIGHLLCRMAYLAWGQKEYHLARNLSEESVGIYRELYQKNGIPAIAYVVVYALATFAVMAYWQNELELAIELCVESEKIADELSNKTLMVNTLIVRGEIARGQGHIATAFQLFTKSLKIVRENSLESELIVDSLEAMARLTISQNQVERAVKLFNAIEILRNTIGYIHTPHTHDLFNSSLREARAYLDEDTFSAAWQAGQSLAEQGAEHVIVYALGEAGE